MTRDNHHAKRNQDGDVDYLLQSSYPWFAWLDGSYVEHGYAEAAILEVQRQEE